MKLDLGGTACYESEDDVCISLDGTSSDDHIVPVIIGDYNQAPFPDNTFDEALGSCYLEERVNFKELYRIMKPGARVLINACMELYDDEEIVLQDAINAGFQIIERIGWVEDPEERYPDSPLILLK